MPLDSKRIWDENGYGRDNPFENTLSFLIKKGREFGVRKDVVETVIAEVLLDVENGREYPKDRCPCGCGIDRSGTAITHDMLKKIISLGEKTKKEEGRILTEHINKIILNHIKKQNEGYIKEKMPPEKKFFLFDWERSIVLKGIKKLDGFFRSRKHGDIPDPDASE
ncbi:MAG: hypothetical protein OCU18_03700 [Candidatus Syntrophoarchaeum sp.]|nr:hypothetical protein [Candidatus Syntrophoarchaeum sp.]